MCEPRGVGIAYCEYIKTHKYCWVNIVDIEVVSASASASTIMTHVKLAFQNEFDCVQVRGKHIRLNLESSISATTCLVLDLCNIDRECFEWKSLLLKIDMVNECVYFEDPANKQKSRRVYFHNPNPNPNDYPNWMNNNPIPWFVFFP